MKIKLLGSLVAIIGVGCGYAGSSTGTAQDLCWSDPAAVQHEVRVSACFTMPAGRNVGKSDNPSSTTPQDEGPDSGVVISPPNSQPPTLSDAGTTTADAGVDPDACADAVAACVEQCETLRGDALADCREFCREHGELCRRKKRDAGADPDHDKR